MKVTFDITEEITDTLGGYRMQQIENVLLAVAREEIRLSYMLAVSGAMRWPLSFRPEVVIAADVRAV